VQWYEIEHKQESTAFPIKLSPLQSTLLELLGVPPEAYQ